MQPRMRSLKQKYGTHGFFWALDPVPVFLDFENISLWTVTIIFQIIFYRFTDEIFILAAECNDSFFAELDHGS